MSRALLSNALTGLEVIADFKARRIRVCDFELAMSQRGVRRPECDGAVGAFIRRKWVVVEGSTLVVTDDGWLAASKGVSDQKVPRKRSGRVGNRRMPAGLF